jgi:hypothetical protein
VKNWKVTLLHLYKIDSPTNTIPQLQHATKLALGDVAGSIVIGSVMVHFGEGLDWIDSFYLSDVTTVGYGDYA